MPKCVMLEQEHILLESVVPYSMITRFNTHIYVARHCMFLCVCAFVLNTGYYGSGIAAYWPYKLTVQQHASLSREEEESKETFLHAK